MGVGLWLPACLIQKIPSNPQESNLHSPFPSINSGPKRVRPIPPLPFPPEDLGPRVQNLEQAWGDEGSARGGQ